MVGLYKSSSKMPSCGWSLINSGSDSKADDNNDLVSILMPIGGLVIKMIIIVFVKTVDKDVNDVYFSRWVLTAGHCATGSLTKARMKYEYN